jgi:hypothetical protein
MDSIVKKEIEEEFDNRNAQAWIDATFFLIDKLRRDGWLV